MTITEAPENSACTVVDGVGTATEDVVVNVTCTDGNSAEIRAESMYSWTPWIRTHGSSYSPVNRFQYSG